MKRPIGLSAFSSRRLGAPEHVENLVRVLMSHGPAFTPVRFGVYEPLKKTFSESSIAAMANEIEHGNLYWKSPKTFATISRHIPGYMHGSISLDMEKEAIGTAGLGQLLCEVAEVMQADLGAVHLLNEHDRDFDARNGTRIDGADGSAFALFPKKLINGLPDIYWAMVFGKPYCELFGAERLLSTPAHTVKPLGAQLVYVQLTADVNDCEYKHDAVMRARQLAKRHLGLEAFVPDNRDGMLSKARQMPLIGKLVSHKTVAPVLAP